ncbi:unnamed protein product [Amaranthus hypochondriacus]
MNTLFILHQPIWIKNPSLYNHKNTPFYPTTSNNHLPFSTTSWKLQAETKGFGGGGSKPSQKKNNDRPSQEQEEEDDDKIPEVVFDRMIRRIVVSVGLPMAIGVVLLKLFDLLKEKQVWDVPLWVSFVTTFVFFGSSVLGVAYGSLSTSWDADNKGSLLGFEQAKENWDEMWKEEGN